MDLPEFGNMLFSQRNIICKAFSIKIVKVHCDQDVIVIIVIIVYLRIRIRYVFVENKTASDMDRSYCISDNKCKTRTA